MNDFYDYKSDLHNPRKGTVFGEKHDNLMVKPLRLWGFAGLFISLVIALFVSYFAVLVIIILSVIPYLYSAFPLRLKSVPIIDSLLGGALYFYLIAVAGYFIFYNQGLDLSKVIKPAFILVALVGLVGHLMGTVLDEESDRKDGTNTSAVFFGAVKVISMCILVLLICLYLARFNWVFVSFLSALMVVCFLGYLKKLRHNRPLQLFGAAFIPIAFFVTTIVLLIFNQNLLKI